MVKSASDMVTQRRAERRSERRISVAWTLEGKGTSLLAFPRGREETIQGRIENINRTGVCLVTTKFIETSSVLQCEIFPAELRMGIPTMMEVRWIKRDSAGPGMRIGLRYLL